MISDIILKVTNISKRYEIYATSHHRIYQLLSLGRAKFYRDFWALRDVSFEVKRGECLGIIGRNGSGKSTLLQIIAGTTLPTTGEVEVHGKVAALLELGSGFNPEFTGRENIYVNGVILGLSKKEITEKFDEIVDFAEVREFIDQPVKTYSSGMFIRLAFSTAAHINTDIILLDETLSVGDVQFQQKCYQKFEEFRSAGRTIIFVSHDMDAVKRYATRILELAHGCTR
jgi:ABC-type polysaccharide/polyol phosphate transport system ATPase subunit